MSILNNWFRRVVNVFRYVSITAQRAFWYRYGHNRRVNTDGPEPVTVASMMDSTATVHTVGTAQREATESAPVRERRQRGFLLLLPLFWLRCRQLAARCTSWEFATATGIIAAILALLLLITTDLGTGRPTLQAAAEPPTTQTSEPESQPPEQTEAITVAQAVTTPLEEQSEPFPDLNEVFEPLPEEPTSDPEPARPEPNPFENFEPKPEPEPVPAPLPPDLELDAELTLLDPEPLFEVASEPIPAEAETPIFEADWARPPYDRLLTARVPVPEPYGTPRELLRYDQAVVPADESAQTLIDWDVSVVRESPDHFPAQTITTCTLRVTNQSDRVVALARVSESIPAELQVTGSEPAAIWSGEVLEWNLEELQPGEERVLKYQCFATAAAEAEGNTQVELVGLVRSTTEIAGLNLELSLQVPDESSTRSLLPLSFEIKNRGKLPSDNVTLRLHLPDELEHPYGQTLDHEVTNIATAEAHSARLHVRPKMAAEAVKIRAEVLDGDETIDEIVVSTRIVAASAPRPVNKPQAKPAKSLRDSQVPCWCVPPVTSRLAPARVLP